jgi:hypothetical protein
LATESSVEAKKEEKPKKAKDDPENAPPAQNCDDGCPKTDEDPSTESSNPVACSLRDKQKADIESAPVLKHQKDIE